MAPRTTGRRGDPASQALVGVEAELRAIYAEADALYADWSCPSSTECCRFGITGREPYVTSVELALVKRAVARLGRPLDLGAPRSNKKGLPLLDATDGIERSQVREERRCPMLTAAGRCSVYSDRPFGCRTFYCDRASQGTKVRHRDVTELVRRLKELASRHQPRGDEGRPLTHALGTR